MRELKLVKGYKNDDVLRNSFNELANQIFGINFECWYQKGYWTEKYEPYSFVDKNKVVANISVNKINLLINGEMKRGLQIGTVMTHPDYRKRGLSKKLMNYILEEYENEYDLMYLFANDTVLNFYPKFGFEAVEEYQYSMDYKASKNKPTAIRKLDGTKDEDLHYIYKMAANRLPVSRDFNTINTQELVMFYSMYVFSEDLYYLENEAAVVIFQHEGEQLHVFDVISEKEMNLKNIIVQIANHNTKEVVFHFTPEQDGLPVQRKAFKGSEVLFVKYNGELVLPSFVKHPITAQA
jgi:predicted GNAT family N-acyltransferase